MTSLPVLEERLAWLSIRLELTVAASALFDPRIATLPLLEKISERLGCSAVLFFELRQSKHIEMKIIEGVGLSSESKELPIYALALPNNFDLNSLRTLNRAILPYPEIQSPALTWNFPFFIGTKYEQINGKQTNRKPLAYLVQLHFESESSIHPAYRGIMEHIVAVLKNTTELRIAEKERTKLLKSEIKARARAETERKRMETALSIRDDFISMASHELRTPITSLRLLLQLIKLELSKFDDQTPVHQKMEKMLSSSELQVDRLTKLILGLLDVSKIQAGKLTIEAQEVNISKLVEEIVNRLNSQTYASKYPIHLDIEPGIIGIIDPLRIEQVLTNLVENAIKYGNKKPIDISLSSKNRQIFLMIQDRGIGIKKNQQKLIFNKYRRVQSPGNVGGLGLGLYIVKQIVKSHGGTITVKSRSPEGTSFIVTLPLKVSEAKRAA